MRTTVTFLVLIFLNLSAFAQIPNGAWRDHLPYNRGTQVAQAGRFIYCSMQYGGMLSYNTESNEINTHSKTTGLSDVVVNTLAYSEEYQTLIAAYENGNLDLISDNDLVNIPAIKNKSLNSPKTINAIECHGQIAYLACGFGIVALDIENQEIKDSYFFGPGGTAIFVNDLTIMNDFIYAATEIGVYEADLNSPNLVDFNSWSRIESLPQYDSEYKFIQGMGSSMYLVYASEISSQDEILKFDGSSWQTWSHSHDELIQGLGAYKEKLTVAGANSIQIYNNEESLIYDFDINNAFHAIMVDDGTVYAAGFTDGFIRKNNPDHTEKLHVNSIFLPAVNKVSAQGDHVWVSSGGPFNPWSDAGAYHFKDNNWRSYNNGWTEGMDVGNTHKIAIDPRDGERVVAGCWIDGILEFKDGQLINEFSHENHPVFSRISPDVGVRVAGLDFDRDYKLWMISDIIINPIFVWHADGTWENLEIAHPIFNRITQYADLLVADNDDVWVLTRNDGIIVLREDSNGDILTKHFALRDQQGELIDKAYDIALDKDNDIWISTNTGPLVLRQSHRIFDQDPAMQKILVPRNDGSGQADYLLDNEVLSEITIDGGNRKWIATENSGVFLIGADDTSTVHNFNEKNSPLFSDNVKSIGVHEKTGEVFIVTNKGMLSYGGRATESGNDFGDVYVYPNPVRPTYEGDVTITGLIADCNVKITDISGNMVYETTSIGGQAIWNGRNYDGDRVATGVYLVFLTNDDGSKTHMTKLVFIH